MELFREEVTEVATAWKQHIITHHRNGGPTVTASVTASGLEKIGAQQN